VTPRALDTRPGVGARFGHRAIAGDAAPLAEVSAAGASPSPPRNHTPRRREWPTMARVGSADDVEIGGDRVGFGRVDSKGCLAGGADTIYHVLVLVL